jgi:hypothetical protein
MVCNNNDRLLMAELYAGALNQDFTIFRTSDIDSPFLDLKCYRCKARGGRRGNCGFALRIEEVEGVYTITRSDLRHDHTNSKDRASIVQILVVEPIVTALGSSPFIARATYESKPKDNVPEMGSDSSEYEGVEGEDEDEGEGISYDGKPDEDYDEEHAPKEFDDSDHSEPDSIIDETSTSVAKGKGKGKETSKRSNDEQELSVLGISSLGTSAVASKSGLKFRKFNSLKVEFKKLCFVGLSSLSADSENRARVAGGIFLTEFDE